MIRSEVVTDAAVSSTKGQSSRSPDVKKLIELLHIWLTGLAYGSFSLRLGRGLVYCQRLVHLESLRMAAYPVGTWS